MFEIKSLTSFHQQIRNLSFHGQLTINAFSGDRHTQSSRTCLNSCSIRQRKADGSIIFQYRVELKSTYVWFALVKACQLIMHSGKIELVHIFRYTCTLLTGPWTAGRVFDIRVFAPLACFCPMIKLDAKPYGSAVKAGPRPWHSEVTLPHVEWSNEQSWPSHLSNYA